MENPRPDTESIFYHAAQRKDRADRAAYLADACGADAALRREMERLLRAFDEAGQILGGKTADPPAGSLPLNVAAAGFDPAGVLATAAAPASTALREGPGTFVGRCKRTRNSQPADRPAILLTHTSLR